MKYRVGRKMVVTKRTVRRRPILRVIPLLVIVILCGTLYLCLWTDCFTIREIHFLGCYHLPADTLDAVKQGFIGGNLLTISLAMLRDRLLRIPEIRQVTFRKRFFHKLDCYLQRREPVAVLAADDVIEVDADGVMILRRNGGCELDLPVITGIARGELESPGGAAKVRKAVEVLELLKDFGFSPADQLSEIHSEGDEIMLIWMGTGTLIRIGNEPYIEKIRKFKAVYRTLHEGERFPALIDLRFDRQVVVR
ncbi:MAG: cell division protein FtsQ/DivIB [bacterium]|nr:MAG: cell division protein FtsQ/DivIB [bacterium]